MEIKANNSLVINKRIDLGALYPEMLFLLLRVTPIMEYDNEGKRTDTVVAHTYECVETMDFNHLKVRVENLALPISNEELQKMRQAGEKVAVEFINPTIMVYINRNTSTIEDSIKADDVRLVEME